MDKVVEPTEYGDNGPNRYAVRRSKNSAAGYSRDSFVTEVGHVTDAILLDPPKSVSTPVLRDQSVPSTPKVS